MFIIVKEQLLLFQLNITCLCKVRAGVPTGWAINGDIKSVTNSWYPNCGTFVATRDWKNNKIAFKAAPCNNGDLVKVIISGIIMLEEYDIANGWIFIIVVSKESVNWAICKSDSLINCGNSISI